MCSMVSVPDEADEDARRCVRERTELISERIGLTNRIGAVLATLGVSDRTDAQGGLRSGSAQEDVIGVAVANGDDTVLGVVLDEIVARAALDLEPGIGDCNVGVEALAIAEVTSAACACRTRQDVHGADRDASISFSEEWIVVGDVAVAATSVTTPSPLLL